MRTISRLAVVSAAIAALALAMGCSGAGGAAAQAVNMFPAGDYSIFVSMHPAQVYTSPIVKSWLKEVDAKEVSKFEDEFKKNMGIKLEEFASVTMAMSIPAMGPGASPNFTDMVVHLGGPFQQADIKRFFKDAMENDDPQKESRNGRDYWSGTAPSGEEVALGLSGNGVLAGFRKNVEDSLDLIGGKGKRLSEDSDFQRAMPLLDSNASFSVVAWDLNKLIKPLLAQAKAMEMEKDQEKAIDAMGELEAVGMSVTMDKDIHFSLKFRFAKAEAAKDLKDFYEENVKKSMKELPDDAPVLPIPGADFTKKDLQAIIDEIKVTQNGDMMLMEFRLGEDSKLMKMIKQGFEQGAMGAAAMGEMSEMGEMPEQGAMSISPETVTTLRNMQQVGQAVEQYIMNNGEIGAPKANTIEELMTMLAEAGITLDAEMFRDGWGNPLQYEVDMQTGARDYRVLSFGSDGRPGPTPATEGVVENDDEDLIWANGQFEQRPAGLQGMD